MYIQRDCTALNFWEMWSVGESSLGMWWRAEVPSVWIHSELCLLLISIQSQCGLLSNIVQTHAHAHTNTHNWRGLALECRLTASASDLVPHNIPIPTIYQGGRGQTNSPRPPHKLTWSPLFPLELRQWTQISFNDSDTRRHELEENRQLQ